jgi:hypothetical protein
LTVIYSVQSESPQKARKSLLPLLVVLFIVSYGILTMLVVEQGRTIEAQRSLLKEMLKDSTQLAALRGTLARGEYQRSHDKPGTQAERKQTDPGSAEKASPKAPGKEKRPGKPARSMRKEVPEKPAADLQDVRRSTRSI